MGNNGRMFLMHRPSPQEVENTLWGLYLSSENEKEEMKARLNYKVSVVLCVVLSVLYVVCCVRLRR